VCLGSVLTDPFPSTGYTRHNINTNNINVDSILPLLHGVDIADAAKVSKVYSLSIFKVEMCRLTNV
jgi:hypothetical protein